MKWLVMALMVVALYKPTPLECSQAPQIELSAIAQKESCIDLNRMAEAIKKAENSKSHPYGVMGYGCNPSTVERCRRICINTLKNRYKGWSATRPKPSTPSPCGLKGSQAPINANTADFIGYVQKTYAPLNAPNDPTGLNRNWIKNVSHFYAKGGNG